MEALLGGGPRSAALDTLLTKLEEDEWITLSREAKFRGEREYVFRHALVREAAYGTLTSEDRVLGHRLAGEWLEQVGETEAQVIAEHFEQGGAPERAIRWYRRAAEQALEADDLPAVLERVERGVACSASGEDLGALRLVEAEARVWRGELALAEQCGIEAINLFTPGSSRWFRAIRQTLIAAGKRSGFDRVERWIEPASNARAEDDALGAWSLCLSECATQLICGGRYADAQALIEVLSRDVQDPAAEGPSAAALLHQMRAFHANATGDPGTSLEEFNAALAAFEQAGALRDACVTRANLGWLYSEFGDFDGAERALREAQATADRMDLQEASASSFTNLGRVLACLGRFEEARRLEELAIDAFRQQGNPRMEGSARTYLALIALLADDASTAALEARAAIESLSDVPPLRAGAVAILARALLDQGRMSEALVAAREAFELLSSLGTIEEGESLIRLVYAEALHANGDHPAARNAIRAARDRLLARAAKITDPTYRESFLTRVPENARTLDLAEQWST